MMRFVFTGLFFICISGSFSSRTFADTFTGDVSDNYRIGLEDAVLAIQLLSGITPVTQIAAAADVNGDGRVGLAEAAYVMQVIAAEQATVPQFGGWDETAVRKVLQTFAYGGHPTDEQIGLWAQMSPREAIDEIMTFDFVNEKLSPADFDNLGSRTGGTLEGLADFFSSGNGANKTKKDKRKYYDKTNWSGPRNNWLRAITSRGLNTFMHRIGFWESNYHMSVNQNVGIYPHPLIRHYDNIISSLSASLPYQKVLATGALNAAVAYQYGHNYNVFVDGMFEGNDDFAREYHQLFFGILGEYDHEYHESVSIENTARALTGIRADYHSSNQGGPDVEIYYRDDLHHTDPLEILNHSIEGPTAKEKIENLSEIAILHEESLDNIPVMIVSMMADDNLTPEKTGLIRKIWAGLPTKDLLEFLKLYAISDAFHSPDRIKYHSSFDKHIFLRNQMQLSNWEIYEYFQDVNSLLSEDEVTPFYPIHNVFGHQTGAEAFISPTIFKNNYNTSTEWYWYYEQVSKNKVNYKREWQDILPRSADGSFKARDVAKWLWQRFVADGLKNYTPLEEAHLYMLLTTGRDLGAVLYEELADAPHPDTVYYLDDLSDPASEIGTVLTQYGDMALELTNTDSNIRERANKYVQRAISFIAASPFTYLQEGR